MPEWVVKPESAEKSTQEKVVFTCIAKGDPEPAYDWYINGVPYEDSMYLISLSNRNFIVKVFQYLKLNKQIL